VAPTGTVESVKWVYSQSLTIYCEAGDDDLGFFGAVSKTPNPIASKRYTVQSHDMPDE
jgi:hypothetical protein